MMEYKGYIATIEYDDSVEMLHGEVINAAPYPIVTFEAADVEGLKREFRVSIDDYLAWCEEDGVEPRRPFSGNLNLRLGIGPASAGGGRGSCEPPEHQRVDKENPFQRNNQNRLTIGDTKKADLRPALRVIPMYPSPTS